MLHKVNRTLTIRVTYDHAERVVALVQEFNWHITHEEDQMQYLSIGTTFLIVKSPPWQQLDELYSSQSCKYVSLVVIFLFLMKRLGIKR